MASGSILENTRAYDQGRDARFHDVMKEENPFSLVRDYYRHKQWAMGWDAENKWRQEVYAVKKDRIYELEKIFGMGYDAAFVRAAGEYRDELYRNRQTMN